MLVNLSAKSHIIKINEVLAFSHLHSVAVGKFYLILLIKMPFPHYYSYSEQTAILNVPAHQNENEGFAVLWDVAGKKSI